MPVRTTTTQTLHQLTARAIIRDWTDGSLDSNRMEHEVHTHTHTCRERERERERERDKHPQNKYRIYFVVDRL